jgi:hypothetical protein
MALTVNVTLSGGFGFSVGGMRYPDDIDANLPTVTFVSRAPRGGNVHGSVTMYMPPAISINDGAGYSELGLGVMGGVDGLMDMGNKSSADLASAAEALNAKSQADPTYALIKGSDLVANAAGGIGSSISDATAYQQGKVLNPNTVLKYDGPSIRDFSFQFTMTPKSKKESNLITSIHTFFRTFMYPEGDEFMLSYPDIWYIKFAAGAGRNIHVPKINDCYLTGCSMTVNPQNNAFHANGAPNEVQLTLNFRETRQNKRKDVI